MKKFLYFIPLLICLISCKNFLQGNNFIENLNEQIDYESQEAIPVRVITRSQEHGSVYPSGDVDFKVGHPVSIEFTLTDNYSFKEWRVIDKETKKIVKDENGKSVMKFENVESSSNKIIVTNATLLTNAQNLQIVPICTPNKDTVAPEIKDNFLFATSQDLLGKQNELLTKNYSEWTSEELDTVHTKSLWATLNFSELDFNKAKSYTLEVTETLIKDSKGTERNSVSQYKMTDIFENADDLGNFTTTFEYPFTSSGDGIVQLDFAIIDKNNNKSKPVKCYALKDTTCKVSFKLLTSLDYSYMPDIRYCNVVKHANNIVFKAESLTDKWYAAKTTSAADMQLFICLDSDDEVTKYPVEHTQINDTYVVPIPEDFSKTENHMFKIVAQDLCGNESFCYAPKLKAPENNFTFLYDPTYRTLKIINNVEEEDLIFFYSTFNCENEPEREDGCSQAFFNNGFTQITNFDLDADDIYFYTQKLSDMGLMGTDGLLSPVTKLNVDNVKLFDSTATTMDFTYTYVSSGNNGEYMFTLTPTGIQGYSNLYVMAGFCHSDFEYDVLQENKIALPCDGNPVIFNLETKYLATKFANDYPNDTELDLILILGGTKDNKNFETLKRIPTSQLTITDNIPPFISHPDGKDSKKATYDRNIIEVYKPYDCSGLQVNEDGRPYFTISYYIEGQMESTIRTITKLLNTTYDDMYIPLELSDLIDADYTFKPVCADSFGNQSIYGQYKHTISDGYMDKKPVLKLNGNDGEISIDMSQYPDYQDATLFDDGTLTTAQYYLGVDYFNNTKKEWVTCVDYTPTNFSGAYSDIAKKIKTFDVSDIKDKFLRIRFYATYHLENNESLLYAEPEYIYASSSNSTSIKNVAEGYGGLTIDCDKPCLVQTYYARNNLGTSASAWERGCSEYKKINPKLYTTHSVYPIDTSRIPDGFYYTVIANFADGTAIMTNVYQK